MKCEPTTLVYKRAVLTCEEIPVTVYRPVVKMVPVVQPSPQVMPTSQGMGTAPGLRVFSRYSLVRKRKPPRRMPC